ncbi:MAG: peptidoglycan-binding domain-containing protein [Prochlorotrichaceae cyanobacterium]|jgi:peptidoglycan hydrolase-like protein with peptidoglycan-binding domain
MEILAYSHLTLTREPQDAVSLSNDRLRTLTAMVGTLALGSAVFAPTPASAQTATLNLNDSGTEVTRLQDRLADLGYFEASSTGFFGPITEDAVTRFQQDYGLQVDGVAGPQTLAALFETTPSTPAAPVATTPPASSGAPSASSSIAETAQANPVTAQLQRDLAALGYDPGPIDGIFGDRTSAALSAFQANAGLPVNGVPSIDTLEALEVAFSNGTRSTTAVVIPENPTTTASSTAATTQTPSSGATRVTVQSNQDAIVVQRGSETGRILVQNDPDRTYVETLQTVPIQVSDRVAAIQPLNSGVPIASSNLVGNLGIGGQDP